MESPQFFQEKKENNKKEMATIIFDVDEDVKKYGGSQKFVLMESDEGFHFGTTSDNNHNDIKKHLEDLSGIEMENRGGGFLKFFKDDIEITDNSSLHLGPLQIKKKDLVDLLNDKISGYNIKLSEE